MGDFSLDPEYCLDPGISQGQGAVVQYGVHIGVQLGLAVFKGKHVSHRRLYFDKRHHHLDPESGEL